MSQSKDNIQNGQQSEAQNQPLSVEQAFKQAAQLHFEGRIKEALSKYEAILASHPNHAPTLHYSGTIYFQLGKFDRAVELIRKAIDINPTYTEALNNLAMALFKAGNLPEAEAVTRDLIESKPGNAKAYEFLGTIQSLQNRLVEAEQTYRKAAELDPDQPVVLCNLGITLNRLERTDEAIDELKRAIRLKPDYLDAYCNLGGIYLKKGQLDNAIQSYRQTLSRQPDHLVALKGIARAMISSEQFEEAQTILDAFQDFYPDDPELPALRGEALMGLYKYIEAEPYFRQAINFHPGHIGLLNNLGNCLSKIGRNNEAAEAYKAALNIEPNNILLLKNLAMLKLKTGDIEGTTELYYHMAELHPDDPIAFANIVYMLQHNLDTGGEAILTECKKWYNRHRPESASTFSPHTNTPDPDRRLKIGYVSPDFRRHAVTYFLEPLFATHNHINFEVYAYAELSQEDEVTQNFKEYSDYWRETKGMDDLSLARQIRADGIDILVDCGGYSQSSRLMAFALKPAPVQIATVYAQGMTTGSSEIDCFLADPVITPEGSEKFFTEKLVRLPHGAVSFQPDPHWPDVMPRKESSGEIVFACFNAPERSSGLIIDIWRRILNAMPEARILFKNDSFNSENAMGHWLGFFSSLDQERIDYEGVQGGWSKNMDVYERIDVVLDSFPITGGTTTAIPLWMGVPVISLAGTQSGQRFGASFLTAAGFPELIAEDADSYVEKAVALARDKDRLAGMRREMRSTMANSSFCDAPMITRDVENAYRDIWQKWCKDGLRGEKASDD